MEEIRKKHEFDEKHLVKEKEHLLSIQSAEKKVKELEHGLSKRGRNYSFGRQ